MHYIKTTRYVGSMHASKQSTTDSRGIARCLLVMHYILGLTHLDGMNQPELMEESHFGLHRCSDHLKDTSIH